MLSLVPDLMSQSVGRSVVLGAVVALVLGPIITAGGETFADLGRRPPLSQSLALATVMTLIAAIVVALLAAAVVVSGAIDTEQLERMSGNLSGILSLFGGAAVVFNLLALGLIRAAVTGAEKRAAHGH